MIVFITCYSCILLFFSPVWTHDGDDGVKASAECDLFQEWDSTNGVGLYAGRDYRSGDVIDVSPTVPIHLNRQVIG